DGIGAEEQARVIWKELRAEIQTHMRLDGLPEPDALDADGVQAGGTTPRCVCEREAILVNAPLVSIVVATRDRPAGMATCLDSLLSLEYPRFEIIVVDNAPSSNATLDLLRKHYGDERRVRYVREDRPGLGVARNRGLEEVRGEIVAFTDDDVAVDRYWLTELVKGFALNEQVACVTGMAFPARLETQVQMWFEQISGFSKGYSERVFNLKGNRLSSRLYPYSAGVFGTGANMAFRTAPLRAAGGFDPALGAGSPALGGEDLAAFFEVIMSGHTLVYQPSAIIHHLHREDYTGLRKQMYGYGAGLTAYLTKCLLNKPARLAHVPVWFPSALGHIMNTRMSKNVRKSNDHPRELLTIELKGMLYGPFAYLWGRGQARRLAKHPMVRTNHAGLPVPPVRSEGRPRFRPVRILEVEIGGPLPALHSLDSATGEIFERAWALVRLHTQPLGEVELRLEEDGLNPADLAREIWGALETEIRAHLRADGLPEPSALDAGGLPTAAPPKCVQEREAVLAKAPFASIVVATHDRPEDLAQCLPSLLSLDYPDFEVIVVDNAPSSNATADLIKNVYGDEARVRYVREDRPGLGCAHNRGLREVRGEIVAFTDDDVLADRYWLAQLVTGFSVGKNVACVTGLIFPRELQTEVQMWIEQYVGFGKGSVRRVFDLTENRRNNRLYPYAAGAFGSGANMAFRTSALRALGGFDPGLGAGSPGVGGDDLAAFFQVIMAGHALVYEPGALVHHLHRRDYAGFRKQVHGYGVGLTAYLTKCLIDRPALLLEFATRVPLGLFYALSARSPKNSRKPPDYPRELNMLEVKGMLHGPLAYIRGRYQTRHLRQPNLLAAWVGSEPEPAMPRAERLEEP
ncbi:MAG TPA: glycosyltransferase, partial [Chloroflexota bacterium]|nr:glycosyltransferase [Chloroflexota bacterium]